MNDTNLNAQRRALPGTRLHLLDASCAARVFHAVKYSTRRLKSTSEKLLSAAKRPLALVSMPQLRQHLPALKVKPAQGAIPCNRGAHLLPTPASRCIPELRRRGRGRQLAT
jgi:hypothetical protein